jgi:hypothetical protein
VVFEKCSATGVLHVHTTRSDGRGEPQDTVQAGVAAGLDFIAFNDHGNLKLMEEGWHGRVTDGLMSIVGTELQHMDQKSHLLVYGVDTIKPVGHILDQLNSVLEMNGVAIIAHPVEVRPFVPGVGEFPWGFGTDCPVSGIEVWNWMSSWKGRLSLFNAWKRIRHPDKKVVNPPESAVDMWFETGGCLVGGADAHGHRIIGKAVFGYEMLFNRVRTHLLLNKPLEHPFQFTEALRHGNCFVSNAIAGDASDYRSALHQEKLYLKLPAEGEVTVRENGGLFRKPVLLDRGVHCIGAVTLPVYIEVRRNARTWIVQGLAAKGTRAGEEQ